MERERRKTHVRAGVLVRVCVRVCVRWRAAHVSVCARASSACAREQCVRARAVRARAQARIYVHLRPLARARVFLFVCIR